MAGHCSGVSAIGMYMLSWGGSRPWTNECLSVDLRARDVGRGAATSKFVGAANQPASALPGALYLVRGETVDSGLALDCIQCGAGACAR